eukprot:12194155-Alexandrium_andersonii.AAC.1
MDDFSPPPTPASPMSGSQGWLEAELAAVMPEDEDDVDGEFRAPVHPQRKRIRTKQAPPEWARN